MSKDTGQRPPVGGSVTYLLMNLPVGIAGFVVLLTLFSVGIGTAVVWVGLPIAGLAVLLARGAARVERARIYALLDSYIPIPYRPLPEHGMKARWKARLRDGATWRDILYFFVLFPLGVLEFVLTLTFWATSLALTLLPVYFRWLPDGAYYFPAYDVRWISVDSTVEALPWAALGVLFVALSVALTRSMAGMHAKFAQVLLGPTRGFDRFDRFDDDQRVHRPEGMQPVAGW
ncbi:sensor domain-containing protein [Amycolatopsis nigrescens]|uniref:sensor domain-containing protein n=1 Tax=Amycolatopsis nigrescens TaxID=381445 RepID=UPI000378F0C7|nr:sensor domain-containing protein [Amycolatopsis nigrescens]